MSKDQTITWAIETLHVPTWDVPKYSRAIITIAAWAMIVVGTAAAATIDKGFERRFGLVAIGCGCLCAAALQRRVIKFLYACDRRLTFRVAPCAALAAVILSSTFLAVLFFLEYGIMMQIASVLMAIFGGLLISLRLGIETLRTAWTVTHQLTKRETPAPDLLQLLLHYRFYGRLPNLEFDGRQLIGSQAAMAAALGISVTSLHRQIHLLKKRGIIHADTGGGITFLRLVAKD